MAINPLQNISSLVQDVTGVTAGGVATVTGAAPITSTGGNNPQIGITTPLALAFGGLGGTVQPVLTDGSTPLTSNWPAGSFNINSLNSTAWTNVAQKATGGTGAIGSPWTGWDTAITWTAGVTYYAPAGFYSYATSPNFGRSGLTLIGDKPGANGSATANFGTVFICTGTGNVFIVDGSSAPDGNAKGTKIANITAWTSNAASAANGFYFKGIVNGHFENLRCGGSAGAGFYLDYVQQSTFIKPVCSGLSQWGGAAGTTAKGYFGVTPTNGMYIGSATLACTTNVIVGIEVEDVLGDGVVIAGSPVILNTFIGGVCEDMATGVSAVNIGPGCDTNTFIGFDVEGTVTTPTNEYLISGANNTFLNCRSGTTLSTNGYHVTSANAINNRIIGTFCARPITIDATASGTRVENVRFYAGISNSGVNSYFLGNYDATNSKWYPDAAMQRFYSRATDSTSQSIANGAFQSLTWGTNALDDGVHSTTVNPTRFTVPPGGAGLWQFDCAISFTGNATGARDAAVKKNGTTLMAYSQFPGFLTNQASCSITFQDLLVDGDYYEFQAFQNSGGALTLTNDPLANFAQAKKVN